MFQSNCVVDQFWPVPFLSQGAVPLPVLEAHGKRKRGQDVKETHSKDQENVCPNSHLSDRSTPRRRARGASRGGHTRLVAQNDSLADMYTPEKQKTRGKQARTQTQTGNFRCLCLSYNSLTLFLILFFFSPFILPLLLEKCLWANLQVAGVKPFALLTPKLQFLLEDRAPGCSSVKIPCGSCVQVRCLIVSNNNA